jgi:hypothetical protein
MIRNVAREVVTLVGFAWALAGCGGPTSPSPAGGTERLAVFLDRETGYTTSDVHDAQDQIVRFTDTGDLIWSAGGQRFPGYIADGQVVTAERVCAGCYFLVRFGSRGGEPRAYLTFAGADANGQTPTVLDVEVAEGQLAVSATRVTVPRD